MNEGRAVVSDLKRRLHDIEGYEPPDLWKEITSSEPRLRSPDPGPARRPFVVAFAFAIALTGVILVARAFGGRESQPISETEVATADAEVTHTIPLSEFPNAVVVGEGGVWVSARDEDPGGEIVRLDPTTAEIIARIPVEAPPGWEFGGAGMAASLGSIWVTGGIDAERPPGEPCCDAVVQRIDPVTNQVAEVLNLGPGSGDDIWVDDSGIWLLISAPDQQREQVLRLDLASRGLVARIDVPAMWSQSIFESAGYIWVLGTPLGGAENNPTTLWGIDPKTNQLARTVPLDQAPWIPGIASDGIWVRTDEGVQKIDPSNRETLGPIPPPPGCCTNPFVDDGVGGVWVAAFIGSVESEGFWHITAEGQIDARGAIEPGSEEAWQGIAYAFDPATQAIWVVHARDSVSRIEIRRA